MIICVVGLIMFFAWQTVSVAATVWNGMEIEFRLKIFPKGTCQCSTKKQRG